MAPCPTTPTGSATRHPGITSVSSHGKDAEEISTSLYPPLNIPEPYISDKKRAVLNGMMKYKKLIDETRTDLLQNYRPSGVLVRPDFSAPDGKHKASSRAKAPKVLDALAEEKNADLDTEDEEVGVAAKKNEDDEMDADPTETKDTEDEDEEQVADNDSADDYTEAVGFDDDEGGFDEAGGGGDDDIF
ncbi:hypothetical protein RvY_10174 [Ramazzottius varieornatus]|uniref:DNA-directed RNA polymerase III subunit n=1 Tax=Ramazzottius varieornatus TaxID=947166 RepID=A0A1D1VE02_RAMVA|nr:hypothetical protein RvY_10174 [Ramazzottius varieornatus]